MTNVVKCCGSQGHSLKFNFPLKCTYPLWRRLLTFCLNWAQAVKWKAQLDEER